MSSGEDDDEDAMHGGEAGKRADYKNLGDDERRPRC